MLSRAGCRQTDSSCSPELDVVKPTQAALQSWMSSNRLKLNPDKTEFIWFASLHNLQAISQAPIAVGSVDVKPASSVRDLGVTFDNALSMNDHISNTVKSCFFSVKQLKHVRRSMTKDNIKN